MKKITGFLILLLSCFSASALDPAHFTVQRISSPYFVVDGNSPATGPTTAYVGFKITNTNALVTYTNLRFTITSVTTSVAGQNYSLTSPANGIALTGTLAPGESKVCYYYVTYPASTTAQGTFNYTLSDATASSKTGNFVIYNRSCISANAGGIATQSINNQDLIGGIVYDDVTYTLGNIRHGDEADFQVSVSTQFDPAKLVLLKTQVIASTIPGVAINSTDKLYFTTTDNQSSGSVTIRWTFRISAYNFTSLILPYAGATSGSSNYKYAISTDLGGGNPLTISSSANPLIITKTSDKSTYGTTNTALFTVTIQNPGAYDISIDKITDELPAGFVYQSLDASGGVTASNSTTVPAPGATGTISFEGGVTSGANTSYMIPAGGNLLLKYSATTSSAPASNLLTTSKGFIGTTQFGSAQNTVHVSAPLPVTLISFKAAWLNEKAKLEWTTATEINSSHFKIEKSPDHKEFHTIGVVAASNNSSLHTSYSFIDSLSLPGINQYRLKMVDIDGKFEYSPVVKLQYDLQEALTSRIYPNPFIDKIQLDLAMKQDQVIHVMLLDQHGHAVLKENHRCFRGSNIITLHRLNRLPAGMYLLQIVTDKETLSQKLFKQH